MSTSILYHGWGLKGYHYVRTDYPQGQIIFTRPTGPRDIGLPGLRVSTADSPRRDGADLVTGPDRLQADLHPHEYSPRGVP